MQHSPRHAVMALILCATLSQGQAQAQAFTNIDAVERDVAAFMGAGPGAAGNAFAPIDRRMKLAACNLPLDLRWYGTRRDTVLVRCPQPGSWKLYVRTFGGSAAEAAEPVVRRGDAVTVTLGGPGFSVSQSAEALENGAQGEWIRIRVSKQSEMRARVMRPGSVAMQMP